MGKILVPYTKTEGHQCAYNQKTGDEIWSINDLVEDANEQIIKLERQNKALRGALEDFLLSETHAKDCGYWDFADDGGCSCMDRIYYNKVACLNRAEKALKEVENEN